MMFLTQFALGTTFARRRLIGSWTFALWLAISLSVFAQSTRVAVIGDPALIDLVDVTISQLSSLPNLTVLERSDLDKLGREQSLEEAVTSNDVSSVRFLPADGLVILRAVTQAGKTGVFARLVAVQPGIVLRETALPDEPDPVARANEIAKEFAPYWAKLAQIRNGKVSALSLLGLRFEVDGPDVREMERKINILLANRLSAEPDTVVLERWRLNDALFEKSLTSQSLAPFWTGSSLIDGSMKWGNKNVEVKLRMRPPNGAEVSISDKDSADHLAELVDRLASKIKAHPMIQGAWQPAAEADHFARLGKWCLDNRLTDQGGEAIESAVALGDESSDTKRLQIRAYASLTFTDEQPDANSIYDPAAPKVDPQTVSERVKRGKTAVDLAGRYLEENPGFSGQPGESGDPVAVGMPVLDNCLRLLRFAYLTGFSHNHPDETTDLRHAVQALMIQMEPLLDKRSSAQRDLFLTYQVRYTPYWHDLPEEMVGYYRDLLNRKAGGATIRTELFESRYFVLHPPTLVPEKLLALTPEEKEAVSDWYGASPWILAWDDQPLSGLSSTWENFLKELSVSPEPVLQADAVKFALSRQHGIEQRDQAQSSGALANFLQKNQDNLRGSRGDDLLVGFRVNLYDATQVSDKTDLNTLRSIGMDLLKQQAILPTEWIRWMPEIYSQLPPDAAKAVLAQLDAYRQWYETQSPQDPEMVTALVQARRPLMVYAGVGSEEGKNDGVTVKQHWPIQAVMGNGIEVMRSLPFAPSMIVAENKVWFMMFGGTQIYCVDPTNLQTVASFKVPDEMVADSANSPGGCCLGVTPQYLVVSVAGHIMLCSRTDNTWRKLDLPPSNYRPCWVNQQLYLIYDVQADLADYSMKGKGAAIAISGLIHVSLPDGGIENVISTRRIPPQTLLDGKPLGYPLDLWASSEGLMLAVDADSPRFQVFGTPAAKNAWALVTSDSMLCDVKPGTGGELIGKSFDEHGFAQIGLMNGANSEILLSNPNRDSVGDDRTARWDIPDRIRTASPDVLWQASPVMRGEDLCLYRDTMNATRDNFQACLYYFAKDQKQGIKIPLNFMAQGNQNPMMVSRQSAIFNYRSLQTTDYGLVVVQAVGGFWVIPWGAIDAYRAHPRTEGEVVATPAPDRVLTPIPLIPSVTVPAPPEIIAPAHPPAPMLPPTPPVRSEDRD
jgi:hypothetical protein